MFGWLGKIFGSEKAVEKGFDLIEKAGDAIWYTDEEKAQDRMRMVQHKDALLVKWMETTQGQNLARRFIALMVTFVWLFMYMVSFFIDVAAVWVDAEKAKMLANTSEAMGEYASQMNGAMMLILAFYFAAPHMDKIVVGALDKFGGKKDEQRVVKP